LAGVTLPPDARAGDLGVELGDELVKLRGVPSGRVCLVAHLLGLGAQRDPPALLVSGRVRLNAGFVLEVPAFPALAGAQVLGPLGAGRAGLIEGVPAGDEHRVDLAGGQVPAAQLHRADAPAVLDGHVPEHVPGQRHRHPLGPGNPGARHAEHLGCHHHAPPSGSACQVTDQPQPHSCVTERSAWTRWLSRSPHRGQQSSVSQTVSAVMRRLPP
jgi:hypothetical protein